MEIKDSYIRYDTSRFFPHDGRAILEYIVDTKLDHHQGSVFSHNGSEITYCYSGEGACTIEKEKKIIGRDSYFIVNPMEFHSNGTESECGYYILGISNAVFELPKDRKSRYYSAKTPYMRHLIEMMIWALQEKGHDQSIIIQKSFELLLLTLKDDLNSNEIIKLERKECDTLDAICRYIDSFFPHKITISMLAKTFSLSESSIMHLFKEKYGISVMEFLRERRLKEAKFQLEKLDDSIQRIAFITGFGTTPYFYKYFKKKTGMTPQEYRKHVRSDK